MGENDKGRLSGLTVEHAMLVVLLAVGIVFFVVPVLEDYPENAAIFPRMTSAVVIIGAVLLLARNYLPGPIKTFVAESVSITEMGGGEEGIEEAEEAGETEAEEEGAPEDRTLGAKYGYTINNTVFVTVTAALYLLLGYAIGLFYVTPVYVLLYTLWFRVPWYIGVILAAASTAVIVGFIEFLLLPFDRGEIIVIGAQLTVTAFTGVA
ncbi:tripartite tricarboxylate transporter TctB family protein [Halomarina halobia]|uniref:Tripartite tricarboxylate transporter TctB family protein n=1 Tax=Halomarina halobia TaxID=3033386 RepID=A0ABD6AE28_9EURY|nr:tripartite tricarboxylate transporter TctB family protein [Halomarina sp. PSR21]